ncbi:MAG: MFS transporter [Chloroflexi bacterium]|nr:MFS transporter [Chloroflexota bacterium]MBU1746902.1 MFS transporter [Chloroflexota bacterium]MBU1878501.1 MFS transporter [Chloroflexota bacterium]
MPTSYETVTGAAIPAPPTEAARFQTSSVILLSIMHWVHDTYTAFLPPLLPVLIENLSLSVTEAGLLTVFMQGPSLIQPVIGHLADRFSLRYFVILAPAVTAVMMSLMGIAPSYAVLALFLVIVGFSSAAMHAVGPVMVGNQSGRNLGRGMGFWMVGGELGRTLGPVIIVSAVAVLTLPGTPWLMIGGLLVSLILYVRFKDMPERRPDASLGLALRPALRRMGPLLIPIGGIILVRSFMSAALTTYLPVFMHAEGADLWLAGVSLTVLEAAGVVGALLGGSLSDRLGRRVVLFISMTMTPLFMFVFLMVSGWAQWPILLAMGFTLLAVTPVMMALVQESFPENRALANGAYMALSFVIRSIVVLAWGLLGDAFGLRLAFVVSAIVPLLGLPFLLWLPKRRQPGAPLPYPPSSP